MFSDESLFGGIGRWPEAGNSSLLNGATEPPRPRAQFRMTLGLLPLVLLHRPWSSNTAFVGAVRTGIARRAIEPIRGESIEALRVPVPVVESRHARRLDVPVRAEA